MTVPGGAAGFEYLLATFFSAVAAVFGYLTRRSAKKNAAKLDTVVDQTNGQLSEKIEQAVKAAVSHDELVNAVRDEAVRDFLDGLLVSHLVDDETGAAKPFDPNVLLALDMLHSTTRITERRHHDNNPGVHTEDSPDDR